MESPDEAPTAPTAPTDPTVPVQADYYGTDETYQVTFPDGVTYVDCKTMTEGDRQLYQSKVNKDVRVSRQSGDMHLKLSTGEERMALLTSAIIGWNVIHDGKQVPFGKGSPGAELEKFIRQAPPSIIDRIEREIRKHESWLIGEATVEDLNEQIENLTEMRDKRLKEDSGNAS